MQSTNESTRAMAARDQDAAITLQRITTDQQRQNAEMTKLLMVLDAKIREVQDALDRHVTISGAQAAALSNKVRERAKALCAKHALPYESAGRSLREALWRALRSEYTVSSHYDIQATRYASALDFIDTWSSYKLLTQLKSKHTRG